MPQPLKVLMAEDNPADAELALLALRSAGFEPDWERVDTEAAYLAQLEGKPDVVLSDFSMPRFNGLRALELLRQSGRDIPFILVSGTIGEDTAVEAIRKGATDYLLKDRLSRLGPAVTHALAETKLRRERRQADESLRIAHGQLGQLLEHSPAVLSLLKLSGDKIISCLISENIVMLLGFTAAEASTHEWWLGQLQPDDRELAVHSLAETIETGASRTEYRLRHKDGHYRWIEDIRRLIRDDAGVPVELIGVWTDITERKRADEIVRQASGHLARDRRKQVRLELMVLVLSAAVFYMLAAHFNWFEAATQWVLANDVDQLDEIVFTMVFVVLGLAGFAFRRWRETESELTTHHQAQKALALLHDELDRRVRQRTMELGAVNQVLVAEVAKRKQSESEVLQLAAIVQSTDEAIISKNLDGMVTSWNRAAEKLLGYSAGEMMGASVNRLIPDDRREEEKQIITRIRRGEGTAHLETVRRRKDGRLINVSVTTSPIKDAAGKIIGTSKVARDITAQKEALELLRASEQRFKTLFDQAAVGVALVDATTMRLVQVNQRFADILGRSREEVEQLTTTDVAHPQETGRDPDEMQQLRTGSIREFTREKRYLRKDGAEVWANLTVSAMWAPGEAPGLCIAVVQDITERKRLDQHFLQAQKMEALGQFSGGVAHDFNNILTAIRGYTELTRMLLKDNPVAREYLTAVLRASERAADLVRQILTFSRQQPQERQIIQLQPVVAESIKLMRATIPATIEFTTAIAADVPTVLANANQVHQVMMNLGINAWHAMADRPGRLEIKLERTVVDATMAALQPRLRPGCYAELSITDTGSGMDPATLRRIFEPFFTTKPPGEGTGLGLAVVHGIMDGHEGAITAASQPGQGTVFHLYFPEHAGETSLLPLNEAPLFRGHGERILVVDDEELLVKLGQKMLTALGYEVEVATEPAVALAMVRADPSRYALVIVDQTMPEMTGLVMARQLLQIRPGLPVILMTGFTASLTSERVRAEGLHALLLKPPSIQSLSAAVRAALAPVSVP